MGDSNADQLLTFLSLKGVLCGVREVKASELLNPDLKVLAVYWNPG